VRFTPSSTSAVFAGMGLWVLFWSLVAKLDSLARLLHVDGFVDRDRFLDWMAEHKGVSLIATELVNIGSHGMGTDSLGVTFSLGGTFINAFVICVILPLRKVSRAFGGRTAS